MYATDDNNNSNHDNDSRRVLLQIEANFYSFVDTMLEFKRYNCAETVPLPELSAIQSLCRLLESFTFNGLAIEVPDRMELEKYNYILKLWFLFW